MKLRTGTNDLKQKQHITRLIKPVALLSALYFLPVILGSCIHSVSEKVSPPLKMPRAYSAPSQGSKASKTSDDRWWRVFADPTLNRLMQNAFTGNFGLRAAWARLEQAASMLRSARSYYWPELSAEAGVTGQRQVFFFQDTFRIEQLQYRLGLAAAYELDVWGRIRSAKRAAEMDLAASRDDVSAMAVSLSAEIAETYFQRLEQTSQLRLLTEQAHTNEVFLSLIKLRLAQGQSSAVDVHQQQQGVAAVRALIAVTKSAISVLEHRLAVLVGRTPNHKMELRQAVIPKLPAVPYIGIPARLLKKRPDIRAAQRRVIAADYRIGAAIANRFPALRVSASTGFTAINLTKLFEGWIWSLAASLVGPLFDGGKRAAEVDRTKAKLREALMNYGQRVLDALREVEDALVQEKHQRHYITEVEKRLRASRSAFREARIRYLNGLSDYLTVLVALRTQQADERELLTAKRQLLSYRIRLCRALGGTWPESLRPPSDRRNAKGSPSA